MSAVNTGMDSFGTRQFPTGVDEAVGRNSAVSWAAILAGAVGAAALSLLLLIVGTGLGLSAVSPWRMEGISATTFGVAAIAWLSFTQVAASGIGGYLAGRLRTRWAAVHTDEVFFRDTAHGFLTWAVASLLTAGLLTSVAGSIIGGGVRAGAAVAGGAASAVGSVAGAAAGSAATLAAGSDSGEVGNSIEYFVDSLFRSDPADSAAGAARQAPQPQRTEPVQSGEVDAAVQQADAEQLEAAPAAQQAGEMVREVAREVSEIPIGEVTRILARALRTGSLPQEDERYIGGLIAQRTDLSQQEAEQRVSEGFEKVQTALEEAETKARKAADDAREATAYGALWMSAMLLLGAFAASLMAVFGGRQRDA